MAFLSANGVSLRYEVTGKGPPLCLIISYRLHGAAWPNAFIESLAGRFSVLTFDNRGTGLSDKPAYGYGLHTMATDVAGLLDGLGWARARSTPALRHGRPRSRRRLAPPRSTSLRRACAGSWQPACCPARLSPPR